MACEICPRVRFVIIASCGRLNHNNHGMAYTHKRKHIHNTHRPTGTPWPCGLNVAGVTYTHIIIAFANTIRTLRTKLWLCCIHFMAVPSSSYQKILSIGLGSGSIRRMCVYVCDRDALAGADCCCRVVGPRTTWPQHLYKMPKSQFGAMGTEYRKAARAMGTKKPCKYIRHHQLARVYCLVRYGWYSCVSGAQGARPRHRHLCAINGASSRITFNKWLI